MKQLSFISLFAAVNANSTAFEIAIKKGAMNALQQMSSNEIKTALSSTTAKAEKLLQAA